MSTAVADHGRRSRSDDSLSRDGSDRFDSDCEEAGHFTPSRRSPEAFTTSLPPSAALVYSDRHRATAMEPQERDLVLRETKPQNDVAAATVIPASLIPALNGFDASISVRSVSNTPSAASSPGDGEATSRHMSPDQNTPQDLSVGSGDGIPRPPRRRPPHCIRRLRPVAPAVRTTVAELEGSPPPRRTMRMIDRRPLAALHPNDSHQLRVVVLRGAVQTRRREKKRERSERSKNAGNNAQSQHYQSMYQQSSDSSGGGSPGIIKYEPGSGGSGSGGGGGGGGGHHMGQMYMQHSPLNHMNN
ncbi:hypothetical protein BV898_19391 [Hypsibius exemplaris]|uniref:Uncharacterized protein n=1 Tax=Hypsibius exemplaris TaxID=2072580 RepID=A0A9X6NLK5_HYPEX|nr:hypothetical protein BV898_19391 [Hypsibius exemplaris]